MDVYKWIWTILVAHGIKRKLLCVAIRIKSVTEIIFGVSKDGI